jgi:hypothetical protein
MYEKLKKNLTKSRAAHSSLAKTLNGLRAKTTSQTLLHNNGAIKTFYIFVCLAIGRLKKYARCQ